MLLKFGRNSQANSVSAVAADNNSPIEDEWRRIYGVYISPEGDVKYIGQYTEDCLRHCYIIGPSGVGKSELLRNIIYQHIAMRHCSVIFEPHYDVIPRVLISIPVVRERDVIMINPLNPDRSPSMNCLELPADLIEREKSIPMITSDMMGDAGIFATMVGANWASAPQMQSILEYGLQLILYCHPKPTFWILYRALNDEEFRNDLIAKGGLNNQRLALNYWKREFPAFSDNEKKTIVGPPNRRIRAFLTNPLAAHLVGQARSTIYWRPILDDRRGKIVCYNVNKTKLGAGIIQFMGVNGFATFKRGAYTRSELIEKGIKPWPGFLMADEFRNFITSSDDMKDMLAEMRKYGAGLILVNQDASQLPQTLFDTLIANASTKVVFRQNGKDASLFAPSLTSLLPGVDAKQMGKSIQAQKAYHAYLQMLVNNTIQPTCSIKTLPPQKLDSEIVPPSPRFGELPSELLAGNESGWNAAGLVENITDYLEAKEWDFFGECFDFLENRKGEDEALTNDYLQTLRRYTPSGKDPVDHLYEIMSNGADVRGWEKLTHIERDYNQTQERKKAICEMSQADYDLYSFTRCVRDIALRQLLIDEPGLIPSKGTRVHLLSDLLYAIPRWEIEAEIEKAYPSPSGDFDEVDIEAEDGSTKRESSGRGGKGKSKKKGSAGGGEKKFQNAAND